MSWSIRLGAWGWRLGRPGMSRGIVAKIQTASNLREVSRKFSRIGARKWSSETKKPVKNKMLARLLEWEHRWLTMQRLGIACVGMIGGALVIFFPFVRSRLSGEVATTTSDILEDKQLQKSTKDLATKVCQHLLEEGRTREALLLLIKDVIRQPATYEGLRDLIIWLLRQEWLVQETHAIAKWSTDEVLDDAYVQAWLEKTVLEILIQFFKSKEFEAIIAQQTKVPPFRKHQ
ncbi:hypothetical protein AAMO2058_001147400 [Amorphochlora amoebiformis]